MFSFINHTFGIISKKSFLFNLYLFGCIRSSLQHVGSLVVAHRLSCSEACEILVPRLGIELMYPVLQGGFLTSGPPGKSMPLHFCLLCTSFHLSGPQLPHVTINGNNTEATKDHPQSVPGLKFCLFWPTLCYNIFFFPLNALLTVKNQVISHKYKDFQSLDKRRCGQTRPTFLLGSKSARVSAGTASTRGSSLRTDRGSTTPCWLAPCPPHLETEPPVALVVKNLPAKAGDRRDMGSMPG